MSMMFTKKCVKISIFSTNHGICFLKIGELKTAIHGDKIKAR